MRALVSGLSVVGVVILRWALDLDIVEAARLLLAILGVVTLIASSTIVASRTIDLRVARRFKRRWVEDKTSIIFVAMSFTSLIAVGLTTVESIQYLSLIHI